jgi:hypothetical protein
VIYKPQKEAVQQEIVIEMSSLFIFMLSLQPDGRLHGGASDGKDKTSYRSVILIVLLV